MATNHTNVWMSRMVFQEESFKPFEDYLGLSNLVKNMNLSRDIDQDNTGYSSEDDHAAGMGSVPGQRVQVWDEFRLNGVDVDVDNDDGSGFQPFAPKLSRKLVSRLPSAKNRRTPTWCVFCKNNGESEMVYGGHILKDSEGRTSCPILRNYTCPICGVSGDGAHTIKYCPLNKEECFPSANLLKTARTSTGKKRAAADLPSGLNRLN